MPRVVRHLRLPRTKQALCGSRIGWNMRHWESLEPLREMVNCPKCLDRLAQMHPNLEVQDGPSGLRLAHVSRNR